MIEKVKELNEWVLDGREPCLEEIEHFACCLNSYFGFLKHHRTYAIRRNLVGRIAKGWWKCSYISGHFEKISIIRKYRKRHTVKQKAHEIRNGVYYLKNKL